MTDEKKAPAAAPAPAPTELARRATDAPVEDLNPDEPWLNPKFHWGGLPVFECPKCGPRIQYPGEGGRQQLKDHMATEHTGQLIPTGLVGSRGEIIYREVKE